MIEAGSNNRNRSRFVMPLLWTMACLAIGAFATIQILRSEFDVHVDVMNFRFERPYFAIAFIFLPILYARLVIFKHRFSPRLRFNYTLFESPWLKRNQTLHSGGKRTRFSDLPTGLRLTAFTLLTVALMGPQSILGRDQTDVEGIDIVITMDVSLSMQAADIEPNRFEATKAVVSDFVRKRPNDRMGAVIFGKDAFTLLPLTTDKKALRNVIGELQLGNVDGEGTAIGNAIGVALNRLRASDTKSKVIILLTDGESNSGNISPEQATQFASTMGVKIFPILMGVSDEAKVQKGTGFFGLPLWNQQSYPINPQLLMDMAEKTKGQYFQVGNRNALEESFHTILDQLEKSEIEDVAPNYTELYPAFVWPAIVGLFLELIFASTWLRRWP